jgi:hypothetical protein
MTNDKLQKDFEKAQAAHKQVVLSSSEKIVLKNRIFAEIEEAPAVVISQKPIPSPFMAWSFYVRAVPVAVLVFVLIGAPIAFAAERSLPGDTLYSVKTKVNEEVVAVFTPQEEKDEYYQELLTKRAGELRVLMKRGEINDVRLAVFEEVLEDNVHVALETSAESAESPEEILQDHQTIVATLALNAEAFGLPEEDIDSAVLADVDTSEIAGIVVGKMAMVELDVVDASAVSVEKTELQKKFGALKQTAVTAFLDRVSEVSDDSVDEKRALVKELVDDAREKVDAIVREDKEDVEENQMEAEVEDAENVALTMEIEAAATTLAATTSVETYELEQILDLHERISRKKVEQDVERLLEESGETVTDAPDDVIPVIEKEVLIEATTTVSGL